MDVIVHHLVVKRVMPPGIEVFAAYQSDSDCSRIPNFVVLDDVPRVVVFDVDGVAADRVKAVVLDSTVLRAPHMQGFAAVFPPFPCSRRHRSIALVAFPMRIVSGGCFC